MSARRFSTTSTFGCSRFFTFMGAVFALVSEAHAARANVVLSGRYISQRRRWLFSFIVSLPRVYGKAQ